jgi:integrase
VAELRKHPKSRFWSARFYDASGKQLTRSTRETDKKKALKIALAFEEAAQTAKTAKHTREVIAELHERITGESLASHSWRVFTESWISRKRPEVKPSTMEFYLNAIGKFTSYLGAKADVQMTELTAADVVGFRNHESKFLAAKTVNHDLKALRMIFRDALQDRVISESPCEFVKTTKGGPKAKKTPFTIPQLKAVMAVADDEWKSMIRFGLYSGQRIGDIANLTWRNVDLQTLQVRLVQLKTGKPVIIPIKGTPLLPYLMEQAGDNPDAPVHPRAYAAFKRNGRSVTVSNQFGELLAQAGLREKKAHRKKEGGQGRSGPRESRGLGFHCLRTTTTTFGAELGIPKEVVMALTGHDSEEMSQHYTNVGIDSLEKAVAALPDI